MAPLQPHSTDEQLIADNAGGVPVIVKVLAFMMLMLLFFTGVTYLGPQVEGEAPKDIQVDLQSLTMAGFIAMGEKLFQGKGTCALCHNSLDRAPDLLLMNMADMTKERLNDPQYRGHAQDSESYLLESMIEPDIHIVPGYGKPGQPSPMPAVNKAPITLSEIEIKAIIAFLQAKDGAQPSVKLPTEPLVVEQAKELETPETTVPASSGEQALVKFGCTACHAVLDSVSVIGPELNTIGTRTSKASIRESIIDPVVIIADGYPAIMPTDYAEKMTIRELDMIVDYLHASAGDSAVTKTAVNPVSGQTEQAENGKPGKGSK